MKKVFLLSLLFLFTFAAFSQTVLLEEDLKNEEPPSDFGPNKKRFSMLYVSFGGMLGSPESDSVAINYWSSYEHAVRFNFKYRISQLYSMGFNLGYNSRMFDIKQDSFKLFNSNVTHKREKLRMRNVYVDVYNRFNFGKRGNYLGNYIEVGAYGEWSYNPAYITYDKYDIVNGVGASNTKQVHKGLIYINPLNYGVVARVGINKVEIYGAYRLSDIFFSNYIYTELPRISVGIEIGLKK